MSLHNADKGVLEESEHLYRRIDQFKYLELVLTKEPLYTKKALLMPNCCFAIGLDTYVRLLDPKYYQNSTDNLHQAL